MIQVKITIPPVVEPISLYDAKTHLRIDDDNDLEDDYLLELISVARGAVETFTGRALITQTWEMYLNKFPYQNYITLPFGNLQSITSITTTDSEGEETILTATTQYLVDSSSDPGRIVLPYAVSWPSFTHYTVNPIKIVFVCGYGDTASCVPPMIKAAIKLILSDLYENRESQIYGNMQYLTNKTAENLMMQYKLWNNF